MSSARAWALAAATSVAVTLALTLAACSSGGGAIPAPSLSPIPATASPTSAASASLDPSPTSSPPELAATSSAATAVPTSDPAATDPATGPDGPMFSDALGVKVATAPGVHSRGDTRQLLPQGLYVHIAWESDPNDTSVFTAQQEDIPILEAYANASLAFYRAATSDLVVRPADFADYMTDSGAQFAASLNQAREGGYVDSLGSGVVLRPYVLGDHRTESTAVVLDCSLSDEQFVHSGDPTTTGSFVTRGQLATMTKVDGRWKVETFSEEAKACL
jgi:hypothetical protein